MRSDNIVSLFQKYNVPHPTFDHLTGAVLAWADAGRWHGAGGGAQADCGATHEGVPAAASAPLHDQPSLKLNPA